MKLWLLKARDKELSDKDNPWKPWFDKAFEHIVRAETESEAREIAHENAGCENRAEFMGVKNSNTTQPWKDSKYSTCIELTASGEKGLIMTDFHPA